MLLVNLYYVFIVICVGQNLVTGSSTTNSPTECTLIAKDPDIQKDLRLILDQGTNMIAIHLITPNRTVWKLSDGDIFDPFTWMRIRSKKGRGMLWLREEFEVLSLTTLTYGVSNLKVEVVESTPGCIANQMMLSTLAEAFVFSDFQLNRSAESSWTAEEELCNRRLRGTPSGARVYYVCCHKDEKGDVLCSEMTRDFWVTVLLTCVVLLNFFVIMYLPLVIPSHLYRASRGYVAYEHKLATELKLRIMKTRHPPKPDLSTDLSNIIHRSALKESPNLRELVDNLTEDKTYELPIRTMHFLVSRGRLISENYVPVGIAKTLYNTILRCKISKRTSLTKCCRSRIFGHVVNQRWNFTWYKCLQKCMDVVILIMIICPWILRVVVYMLFEKKNHLLYQKAAISRGLSLGFRGSFTLMLNPLHVVFIVCYALIFVDILLIGLLQKTVTDNFVFVLKKCFRDMRDRSPKRVIGWGTMVLLKPCEKCGILALILAPIYWILILPLVLFILLVSLFPTINLTVRCLIYVFINFLPSKKSGSDKTPSAFVKRFTEFFEIDFLISKETFEIPGNQTLSRRSAQITILLVCLITMYSTIFLITECITFFVEVAVYTVIGIILNSAHTMQYVSLVFMLFLYGKDCFGSVSGKYLVFNKTIISTVMAKADDQVKQVSWLSEDLQANTAFQLKSETPVAPGSVSIPMSDSELASINRPVIVVKENVLRWKIKRLVLFLDKRDTPYITERFFFDTSKMPCCGSPGPLLNNLCGAISGYLVIIGFLLFVLLVVITFGDMYDVNSSNQTLAALAGGFLPWVFRNVLFKRAADPTVDTSNLHFQGCFGNVIERYVQTWPFDDIEGMSESKQTSKTTIGTNLEMREVENKPLLETGRKGEILLSASHSDRPVSPTTEETIENWKSRVREVEDISILGHDLIIDVSKQKKDNLNV
ncbi:uncharacterized protein [Argopecten irradians]|uniref:uncharacterized protein n=1 Tax=Argopecten irradians TaxID=31199 RepID=UPI0037212A9D